MLDSEEYLHLAIHATRQGLHHHALEYLHKCLEQDPENANATFLLAAEHAELGLFERAIGGMKKSIVLNDRLEMAYYQLALLYMQQGDNAEAQPLWLHLAEQQEDECLQEFSKGMSLLITDTRQALIYMDQAQKTPHNNDFLRNSMASITESIRSTASLSNSESQVQSDSPVHELFVNAYKDALFNNDDK